jgi:hypothetical protein
MGISPSCATIDLKQNPMENITTAWPERRPQQPTEAPELQLDSQKDGGGTFADKLNLSNKTTADSIKAEAAADGNTVIVTWCERNATNQEPVTRTSTDNGLTFGPMIRPNFVSTYSLIETGEITDCCLTKIVLLL